MVIDDLVRGLGFKLQGQDLEGSEVQLNHAFVHRDLFAIALEEIA